MARLHLNEIVSWDDSDFSTYERTHRRTTTERRRDDHKDHRKGRPDKRERALELLRE